MAVWESRVRDIPSVLRLAGRLLARHWPALATIALIGAALRSAAVWAAVTVSDANGWAGQLILIIGPIAYLAAIVAMIQLCRRSAPSLPVSSSSRLLDVAVSVLVPFLTVYVAAGIAGIITSVEQFAMFFGGRRENGGNPIAALALAFLAPVAATVIQLAISRTREFDADEDGSRLTGDPLALASALRKLELGTAAAPLPQDQKLIDVSHQMIANPFAGGGFAKLFATHPPMDQRIARLQAMASGL